MSIPMTEGARIVVQDWLRLGKGERVTIVSDELHLEEAMELRRQAVGVGAVPVVLIVQSGSTQSGELFDARCVSLLDAEVVIGATDESIMTIEATRDSVDSGTRFLSLPLSTNNGCSLLENDMLTMDPERALRLGSGILTAAQGASAVGVSSAAGTELSFSVAGRRWSVYRGVCDAPGLRSSASFEVSVSVVEGSMEGLLVLDGSMGYIGMVEEPVRLRFKGGRLADIDGGTSARRLVDYIASFQDEGMRVAGEFGIGLNEMARCCGRSYIEDESAYGTFHVGLGRNLALGGGHNAKGHFDLVAFRGDIRIDGVLVVEGGELLRGPS